MTRIIKGRFRRALVIAATLPAVAGLALGLTAASASAATTAPAHHQRCDETLTYVQEGFFGGHFVFVRDVCPGVEVFRAGRHGEEDVFYRDRPFRVPTGSFREGRPRRRGLLARHATSPPGTVRAGSLPCGLGAHGRRAYM